MHINFQGQFSGVKRHALTSVLFVPSVVRPHSLWNRRCHAALERHVFKHDRHKSRRKIECQSVPVSSVVPASTWLVSIGVFAVCCAATAFLITAIFLLRVRFLFKKIWCSDFFSVYIFSVQRFRELVWRCAQDSTWLFHYFWELKKKQTETAEF